MLFGLIHRDKTGKEIPLDVEGIASGDTEAPAQAQTSRADSDAEVVRLRAELASRDKAVAAEAQKARDLQAKVDEQAKAQAEARVKGIHAAAAAFADGLSAKITPAVAGPLARVHAFAALSAAGLPTLDEKGQPIDAVADLASALAALPDHGLGSGSIASSESTNLKPMANGTRPADELAAIRAANDAHYAAQGYSPSPAN